MSNCLEDLSKFNAKQQVQKGALNESTYAREFKEKKVSRERARTQIPSKKLGKVGNSVYQGDFVKNELVSDPEQGNIIYFV